MRTPLRKLFSAMLACAITIGIAPVTTHAEGEGYTVQIQYDENTTIHWVDKNGTKVILYCLQDKRHWPHTIRGSIEKIPLYKEITFEEFCKKNRLINNEDDISTLAEKMRRVLYAGYDYNGLGVYSSDGIVQITEEEFNSLLALADDDPLRTDFPDSIGDYKFTYANRNSKEQIDKVTKFMQEAMDRILKHTISASGMTPSELEILPFYRAAFCLANNSSDPLGAISAWNTAYNATSYAVWSLAGQAGITDAEDLSVVGLGKELLKAAVKSNASVLKSEPTVSPQLTQNAVFTHNDNDQKWYSSPITLSAEEISTRFTLQLPSGITAVDEVGKVLTEVKPGDTFSLVSDQEPSGDTEVSVSSSVPWMVGDLVVYEPDPSVLAPDGKSFQNMIGVVINHTEMSAKATVRKVDDTTSLSFTKQWNDDGNVSGKRPDASSYAKSLTLLADGKELSGYEPEITDNGDNTYTVSYKGLPKMLDGKTVKYSVKEAAVEGYTSESFAVSGGGTLVNTLIVPTPSPTATATVTENKSAPTATVKVTGNKPVPAAVKAVPATGVKSSYGENSH